jgi:hypothetical protein
VINGMVCECYLVLPSFLDILNHPFHINEIKAHRFLSDKVGKQCLYTGNEVSMLLFVYCSATHNS